MLFSDTLHWSFLPRSNCSSFLPTALPSCRVLRLIQIFGRNCFGSYFDLLKELTYSPKTGEQFSFQGSSATRMGWDTQGKLTFPDENYGETSLDWFRIIMSLLSLG